MWHTECKSQHDGALDAQLHSQWQKQQQQKQETPVSTKPTVVNL